MEKRLELTLLYDFYSPLLTKRQRDIFELYVFKDYSLQEASSQCAITRQAVLDLLKRTERALFHYEEKLKLAEQYKNQKKIIDQISLQLDTLTPSDTIEEIKRQIRQLL